MELKELECPLESLSASYYQAVKTVLYWAWEITVADVLIKLYSSLPHYIELLTEGSVAFQEAEGREVVVKRDSPLEVKHFKVWIISSGMCCDHL